MSEAVPGRPPPARRAAIVPFGTYTRTLGTMQIGHVATALSGLLVVAMTLDLAPRADTVAAQAADPSPLGVARHMLWYIALRLADLTGSLLPLGCFLGIFWVEVMLTLGRERIVIWNGGRSPLQGLVPLLLIGLLCGAVQTTALAVLRPAAVAYQIEHGIGEYGRRFDRALGGMRWIMHEDHLVRARIDFRAPRLVDVRVYRLEADGSLAERIEAASASPAAEPGRWTFVDGRLWRAPAGGGGSPQGEGAWFDEETFALPIDPFWLAQHGIDARYLPQRVLAELVRRGASVPDAAAFATWWHVRLAQFLLPFGMMLVASALAMTLIAHRARFGRIIVIALVGYFLYVTTSSMAWLGEYGQLHPLIAAWLMPLVSIAAGLALMIRLERASGRVTW